MTKDNALLLREILAANNEKINTGLPCKIKTVNEDGTVDVLVIRNDAEANTVFPNVPVKHIETTKAYVFLGMTAGDRGIIRFLDKSIEEYKGGSEEFNEDPRNHSLSDGVYEIGFFPSTEAYAFPKDKTIEIGNKNGSFKMSISESGELIVKSNKMAVECPITTFKGNVVVDGNVAVTGDVLAGEISLLSHIHGGVIPGPSKTGVPE